MQNLVGTSISPLGKTSNTLQMRPGMKDNSTLYLKIENITDAAIENICILPGLYPVPKKIASATIAEYARHNYSFPAGAKVNNTGEIDYSAHSTVTGSFADIVEFNRHMRDDVVSLKGMKIVTDDLDNYSSTLMIRDFRNPIGKPYGENVIHLDAFRTPMGTSYNDTLYMQDFNMLKDKYLIMLLSSLAARSYVKIYFGVDGLADSYSVRTLDNNDIG